MFYIVAHDDVDGVASHAILERYAKENDIETKHYFVNYQTVDSAFKEIMPVFEKDKGDKLVLADLGYNGDSYASFLGEEYQKVFGMSFSWYDHHQWPEGVAEDVSNLAEEMIIDTSKCASEILKNRFLPDDDVAENLAYLGRAHDFKGEGFCDDTYERACRLQDVISSGYDKKSIVELLSKGSLWNDVFESAYNNYQNIKADIFREIDRTRKVYDLYFGNVPYKISMAHVPSGFESSKDVRKHLFEVLECDLIVAIWPEDTVGDSRVAYEVRSEEYEPILEFMKDVFHGGGRALAGGGTYRGSIDPKDYDEKWSDFISTFSSFSQERS